MNDSTKNTKQPWHKADVKAALEKKGHTIRSVAKSLGIRPGSISHMLTYRTKMHRVAHRIAELIDVPVDEIWPGQYNYTPRTSYKDREAEKQKQQQAQA